jgi:hypothetical protein
MVGPLLFNSLSHPLATNNLPEVICSGFLAADGDSSQRDVAMQPEI